MAGGDLQKMRERVATTVPMTRANQSRVVERYARKIEENNRRRAAAEEAARQAAMEQQKINAQMQRDKLLQQFEQQNTGQRAMYAADAAARDFGYTSKLTKQQQQGTLQRDELQNRFDTARARQQAREQEERDRRLFEQSQMENATQFQNQLFRDDVQQGYTRERDQFQNDATRERDVMQFGFGALRDDQQQRNMLQRDAFQTQQQRERDKLLNEFSTAADRRQHEDLLERTKLQNEFATEADYRQQGFAQQSMYQREAAEVSARWQEQIAQARNAGMDFSERQKAEIKELNATFQKNVVNGPYDEGLKQQALVELQKKLAAIIPEERVTTQDEEIAQTFYEHPTLGVLKRSRTSQGFPDWEPLGTGVDRQAEAQQRKAEQQQQAAQKATVERLDRYRELVNELSMEMDPVTNEPIYKKPDGSLDRAAVQQAAMDQFKEYEKYYRETYGLPPLSPYQVEADAIRAKEMEQERAWLEGPSRETPEERAAREQGQRRNPYRQQPQGGAAMQMEQQRPSTMAPPVISGNSPLPKQVVERLKNIPGGDQLQKLRERHGSKSVQDQTVKLAVDIMINAMMTGDDSDPDLAEAQDILERAGFRIGQ